ncbi:MAG TPA: class I SAM-dependent methyltransferase, partial [Prochlorococcus sp.]
MAPSCSPKHGWFESVAESYAQQRPHYPESLFAWMSNKASSHQRCWDVACGNGQASLGLARHFHRVDATDLSPAQVAAATAHPCIHYQVAA